MMDVAEPNSPASFRLQESGDEADRDFRRPTELPVTRLGYDIIQFWRSRPRFKGNTQGAVVTCLDPTFSSRDHSLWFGIAEGINPRQPRQGNGLTAGSGIPEADGLLRARTSRKLGRVNKKKRWNLVLRWMPICSKEHPIGGRSDQQGCRAGFVYTLLRGEMELACAVSVQ
jgi:hypothetical protein